MSDGSEEGGGKGSWSLRIAPQDLKGVLLAAATFFAAFVWNSHESEARIVQASADRDRELAQLQSEMTELRRELNELNKRCRQ